MGVALLKLLDRPLSIPALTVGFLLGRLAGSFRIKGSSGRGVILRPGGMGDLICSCIALERLALDPASFFWVIERRSRLWATYLKLPHLCYDELASLAGLIAKLGSCSLVINSEQRFGLSQALALALRKIGGRVFSFDTNRGSAFADVRVPYDWNQGHEVREFERLFRRALHLPQTHNPLARSRLRRSAGHLVFGISGADSASRSLELDQWREIIGSWVGMKKFWIAAAPVDGIVARGLAERFPGQAYIFSRTFGELCEFIASAQEMLVMDGGMSHIASYFGIPSTVIFTSGRHSKWAPLGEDSWVVKRQDLLCQPCTVFGQTPPCPYRYRCKELTFSRDRQPASLG